MGLIIMAVALNWIHTVAVPLKSNETLTYIFLPSMHTILI
jgi:hypothetical protein